MRRYLDKRKFESAEQQLLTGYKGLAAREEQIPETEADTLTTAIDRLVKLYQAWVKPDDAAIWTEKRNELKQR